MKRILINILIAGLLLMCSCGSDKSTVGKALGALLNCDNYRSELSVITNNSKMPNSDAPLLIFHNPYKSKCAGTYDHPNEQGHISVAVYEVQDGSKFKQKYIYTYESGDTKEVEFENKTNEEFLIEQIKDCLISEEFIGEQVIDGTNVKKYKIAVTAYPFGKYLRVPYDKNDFRTKIFMDEYKTCEGYVYINSKTNYIQKIEFDLSDKMLLNKEIVEKITSGIEDRNFTMPDYSKFIITMVFSDINDNSEGIRDTEKEIDSIMQ
jgi:hypothetical protein